MSNDIFTTNNIICLKKSKKFGHKFQIILGELFFLDHKKFTETISMFFFRIIKKSFRRNPKNIGDGRGACIFIYLHMNFYTKLISQKT